MFCPQGSNLSSVRWRSIRDPSKHWAISELTVIPSSPFCFTPTERLKMRRSILKTIFETASLLFSEVSPAQREHSKCLDRIYLPARCQKSYRTIRNSAQTASASSDADLAYWRSFYRLRYLGPPWRSLAKCFSPAIEVPSKPVT